MKYSEMTAEQKAEIDAYRAQPKPFLAERKARKSARKERLAAKADVPSDIRSVPEIRDELQRLNDKLNAVLAELRGD